MKGARIGPERNRVELSAVLDEVSTILDSTPLLMLLVDGDRRVRRLNRAVVEFTERTREESVELRAGEVLRCLNSLDDPRGCGFGPKCPECMLQRLILDTFDSGKSHSQEEIRLTFFRGEEKEEKILLVSTSPVNVPDGRLVLVCAENITERKNMEEGLRRANRALRVLSGCNAALVRTTDEQEFLQKICRTAVEIGGYRLAWVGLAEHDEEKTVRPAAQWGYEKGYLETLGITWADTERGRGPTGTAIRTGKPSLARNIQEDPDFAPWRSQATERGYTSSLALPLTSSGRTMGALNIYAAEPDAFDDDEVALLVEMADDVAYGVVALRVSTERDVMEKQLRTAQRMELLGQMASGVAHEVRNPLNAILAVSEALGQNFKDNPEYAEYLSQIRTQVDRLSQLMQDLLDLGSPLQPSRMDRRSINEICRASVNLWRQSPQKYNNRVEIICSPEGSDLIITCDGPRLQQVLINLIENAAQHGPEGSEILLEIPEPDEKSVHVRVIDRGSGISPENAERIFEPFFTTRKRGTGLGLNIVRHIVDIHGGNVTIRNNDPPPGCTVEVNLPRGEES